MLKRRHPNQNEEDVMMKEDYQKIRSLLSVIDDVEVNEKHGGRFLFPIYMTDSLAKTDIEVLELSVRANNCLRRAKINTIGDLCEKVRSSSDLKNIRNCGKTSIAEIMDSLFAYQYSILKPERRAKFLEDVIRMNLEKDGANLKKG